MTVPRKSFYRLFEYREETKHFFREMNSPLAEFLLDEMWSCKLAYLADIFGPLNELNTSLQGPCMSIFVLRKKTDAFKQKLALWDIFNQINSFFRQYIIQI